MKSVAALVIVLELSAAVLAQTTTRTSTFVTSTNPSTPTSGGPSNQTSGGPSSLPSCSEPGFGYVVQEHPMAGFPTDPQNARHFDTAPILQEGVTTKLGFGISPTYPVSPINIYGGCPVNFTGKAVMHYAYFRPKAPGSYFIADVPSGSTVFMWNSAPALEGYAFGYNQNYYGAPYGSNPRCQFIQNVKVGDIIPIRILAFKSSNEPSDGGLTHAGFDFKIFGPTNDPDNAVLISSSKDGSEYFFKSCPGQKPFKGLGTKATASTCAAGATVTTTVTVSATGAPATTRCPSVSCSAVTAY